MIKRT